MAITILPNKANENVSVTAELFRSCQGRWPSPVAFVCGENRRLHRSLVGINAINPILACGVRASVDALQDVFDEGVGGREHANRVGG